MTENKYWSNEKKVNAKWVKVYNEENIDDTDNISVLRV